MPIQALYLANKAIEYYIVIVIPFDYYIARYNPLDRNTTS